MKVDFTSHKNEVISAKNAAVTRALTAIGIQCVNYATELCPVDTGRLSASISSEIQGDYVVVGTPVEYGKYVELGTSRMKNGPQPFLRPAAQNHTDEYKAIAESVLKG